LIDSLEILRRYAPQNDMSGAGGNLSYHNFQDKALMVAGADTYLLRDANETALLQAIEAAQRED
jgi:hypothetical protein